MLASVRALGVVGSPRAHNLAPSFRRTTGVSATPLTHKMSTGEDIQLARFIGKSAVVHFVPKTVSLLFWILFGIKPFSPLFFNLQSLDTGLYKSVGLRKPTRYSAVLKAEKGRNFRTTTNLLGLYNQNKLSNLDERNNEMLFLAEVCVQI